MKLNLGCGFNKQPGFLNVDVAPECHPDQVVDLEQFPWPFEDNCASVVLLAHVLEHLGQSPAVYLRIIKELYRICAPGATVHIRVPHPRHDLYLFDPTHVRPITPEGLEMFSQKKNRHWQRIGASNTPLGIYHHVDFDVMQVNYQLDPIWQRYCNKQGWSQREAQFHGLTHVNAIAEIAIDLKAVK